MARSDPRVSQIYCSDSGHCTLFMRQLREEFDRDLFRPSSCQSRSTTFNAAFIRQTWGSGPQSGPVSGADMAIGSACDQPAEEFRVRDQAIAYNRSYAASLY